MKEAKEKTLEERTGEECGRKGEIVHIEIFCHFIQSGKQQSVETQSSKGERQTLWKSEKYEQESLRMDSKVTSGRI